MIGYRLVLAICLLKYIVGETTNTPVSTTTTTVSSKHEKYPLGDHRNCPSGPKVLDVLPGLGWDGLAFHDAAPVLVMNYSRCLTTDDGKYFVPDTAYVMRLRESSLNSNAKLFDDWRDYTSVTAPSMKYGSEVSGSFFPDFEQAKKNQVVEKALTMRAEIRHGIYTIQVDSSTELHPTFRGRLHEIAQHLENGEIRKSRILAELVIRDYGTHVITKIQSGGVITREDAVKLTYLGEEDNMQQATAIATEVFYQTLKLKMGESMHKKNDAEMQKYKSNCISSEMKVYGGQSLDDDFSYSAWTKSLDSKMAAIDRLGDPLYFVITTENFPGLPQPLLQQLKTLMREAIREYDGLNTHPGCTDLSSPNFSYLANLDDGSCLASQNNYTFGGVYQTCELSDHNNQTKDYCEGKMQKNLLTGNFSCPENFTDVVLYKDVVTVEYPVKKCYEDELFGIPYCKIVYKSVRISYKTFWCAAKHEVAPNTGYLFGGVFTKFTSNLVTGTTSCPPDFYPLVIGEDLHVCVSIDYEKASEYAVQFGGFFSCLSGNPLTKLKNDISVHKCPEGYSKHMAAIYAGCEINYCMVTADIKRSDLPRLVLPPFSTKEEIEVNATMTLLIVDEASGKVWFRTNGSESWIVATGEDDLDKAGLKDLFHGKNSSSSNHTSEGNSTVHSIVTASPQKEENHKMSSGTIATIAICSVIAVLVALALTIFAIRRRNVRPRSESKANLQDSEAPNEPNETQDSNSHHTIQEAETEATESES